MRGGYHSGGEEVKRLEIPDQQETVEALKTSFGERLPAELVEDMAIFVLASMYEAVLIRQAHENSTQLWRLSDNDIENLKNFPGGAHSR